jgi:ParB family chromosome partitioning protein
VADGLSVREVEDAVRARSGTAEPPVAGPDGTDAPGATVRKLRPPGLLELEELFSQYLDTRVAVTMGPQRGKVTVDFADLEDLERLYRRITGVDMSSDDQPDL